MSLPRGKGRVAVIALLCASLSGLLGLTILAAPMASPRGVAAPRPVPPPPRAVWTPIGGAETESISIPIPTVPSPVSELPASEPPVTSGVWTAINSQPFNFGLFPGSIYLLTDGRILAENDNFTAVNWWTLTPDNTGSYINGTWTEVASPPSCGGQVYSPLYHASAVLADGRFVMIGGEYNNNNGTPVWTNQGAIYDPVANSWSCITAPSGWVQIGDAQSIVLADGTFMVAHPFNDGSAGGSQVATLNASTNPPSFNAPFTPSGKSADAQNDEEGWELLPDNTVLTLEVFNSNDTSKTPALTFNSSAKAWSSAGSAPDVLVRPTIFEIGPALLRPDGTLFASGAVQKNDIYDTSSGTWSSGPSFPTVQDTVGSCTNKTEQFVAADAPAALLPDGNVLLSASPIDASCGGPSSPWITPTQFFEFDGTNLTAVANPDEAAAEPAFVGRLLLLPNGQVMYGDTTGFVEIYTPAGSPDPSWAPTITGSPLTVNPGGKNFLLTGTQFNGLSQAVAYGDDYQAATNYPLVRITNTASGHVFYARTHSHSTMAVATGATSVTTEFDVPNSIELGASTLVVVANGIASLPAAVTVTTSSITPTPTATPTATATATATATNTPTSTATPGPGKLGVSPLSLTLKTTGEAPVSKPLLIKNKGTGPLNVTVSGPKHNPPFSVDTNSFTVAPNATSTVTITFAPTRKGTKTDSVSIKSAKPKKSFQVFLTGKSK